MEKAAVLNWNLQQKLKPHLKKLQPRASIYRKDFIAANQEGRANNLISGTNWEAVTRIREDIRDFKAKKQLDKVRQMGWLKSIKFEKGISEREIYFLW